MISLPAYFTWLIAAAVVLLLLWLAWRRPNRQRLAWRLLASAVAGISLVLLVYPPATQQAISPGTAILLTDGYNADTLDALLQQQEAKPQVYTYKASSAEAVPLPTLQTIRQHQPGLHTLHLLGYGMQEEELRQLRGMQVYAHLSTTPAGVQEVQWSQSINLGDAIEVAGRYTSRKQEKSKLYLYAAGKVQDSTEVETDNSHVFSLRYTPKQAGRFSYTLLTRTGGKVDTLGQLPVQVKPTQELGVLLIASSPNFEFRFLKNHLAELQHKVALRTTVSKGIHQTEWLNMPRTDLDRISPKLLQDFDVVITDPQALQNMSNAERNALQRATTEDGLGILTIAAAPVISRRTTFFTGFKSKRISQQNTRSTRASWTSNTAAATAAPYTLVNTAAVSGIVEEDGNDLLAGAKKAGWGKVAISFIPQTFPWQLEGKTGVYASYWANLLSAVAKEQMQEKFWVVEQPQVPQPNLPVTLTFTDFTAEVAPEAPNAIVMGLTDSVSVELPLAQNIHQPEKYSATFWPHNSGWYQVMTPDAEPYFFYVHEPDDWPYAEIQAKRQATQEFAARQSIRLSESPVTYKEEPVSLIWFFVLFVLSSGYLWLEEKS